MSKSLFVYVKKNSLLIRAFIALVVVCITTSSILPLMVGSAAAATQQITQRSVTIGSGVPSASTSYSFSFTTPSTGFHLDGIKLIACTTAIGSYPGGSCSAPSGFSFASATYGSIGGFTDSTAFTIDTAGANDCIATGHPEVLCLKRTSSSNDTGGAKTLVINAVVNPSTVNTAFYLGITTYNSNTWPAAGAKDAGTVATAVVQTLQVNARVAEILNFCVGNTAVDNATTDPTNSGNHDCTVISGASVNLGTLDSGLINISPVTTNGGDSNNGIAMVRSNAGNGVAISYDAIQALTGTKHLGTLRLSGAACDGSGAPANGLNPASNDNIDGCINAAGSTQNTFTAGTEEFGMTIAGVNCGSTTAYTCVFSSGSNNLVPQTNYIGKSGNSYCTSCNTADGGNGFAWNETGASTVIASSASSTIKQVDDEALILKFAATSNIITPFGSYSVQADFTAVPTY